MSHSTLFQLCRDRSQRSAVVRLEPATPRSRDKHSTAEVPACLLPYVEVYALCPSQHFFSYVEIGDSALVRLEPATPRSRDKHSTAELPTCSYASYLMWKYMFYVSFRHFRVYQLFLCVFFTFTHHQGFCLGKEVCQ